MLERFVVGTGRCGSTLLSRMLAECEAVLSIFEFFTGLDWARRFGAEPIAGKTLARIICSEQPFLTAVLRRGFTVEEITYPFAEPGRAGIRGRFGRGDPLPWILVAVLPRLTDAPDALMDELIAYVTSLGAQRPRDHYRQIFEWLTRRFDRPCWVERSGSSIEYAGELLREYPDARIVHIHRSGPEVALSMREHHAYRLPVSVLYDVPLADGQRVSQHPPLDFDAAPHQEDTLSRILASRPPAEYFGRYWADQVVKGRQALDAMPADHLLEVSFDELIESPRRVLSEIAALFELPGASADETRSSGRGALSSSWIERASGLIQGRPKERLESLRPEERRRLIEACGPGIRPLSQR